MLAPATLAEEFSDWNRREGAPYGHRAPRLLRRVRRDSTVGIRVAGPYAWQGNNTSRRFEYPWAYTALASRGPRRKTIVEIGGGLSGLQFSLARDGHTVYNLDPGGGRWAGHAVDHQFHAKICRALRAPVTLIHDDISTDRVAPCSADAVVSVSTVEHLDTENLATLAAHVPRILKPGGYVVMTIDLFLNLAPFTSRQENEFGTNINVRQLVEAAELERVEGDPSLLHGYPEFDASAILRALDQYLIGSYPVLVQCVVARRPD